LLGLLVGALVPTGPLVLGIDESIERRRGKKIAAAGIYYRDPVRSSHSHFVKVRGLRWVCLMLLAPIAWAGRVWALPFFTVLAPSERTAQRQGRRFKPLTTWARQMIRQVHRWQPNRELVVVGERTYAALELLDAAQQEELRTALLSPPPGGQALWTGRLVAAWMSERLGRPIAVQRGCGRRDSRSTTSWWALTGSGSR
jgi:DDE superfamily endonuclease